MSIYQEFTTLPLFEKAVFGDGKAIPSTNAPRWSGVNQPPEIGQFVLVKINGIGPAKVIGYFVEGDWLGLRVQPLDPPEWFVNRNGYFATGHAFGAEIAADPISAPVLTGRPSQEQLAALQGYANAKGRCWKNELSLAWSTGADGREPNSHFLRQVRNQFGTKWLFSTHNPIHVAKKQAK